MMAESRVSSHLLSSPCSCVQSVAKTLSISVIFDLIKILVEFITAVQLLQGAACGDLRDMIVSASTPPSLTMQLN